MRTVVGILGMVGTMAWGSPAWAQEGGGAAEPPRELAASSGGATFRPGVLLQGWYYTTVPDDAAGEDDVLSDFRLRRAEFKARGALVPGLIEYNLMIDFAKLLEFRMATVDVQNQYPEPPEGEDGETVDVLQPRSSSPYSALQDYMVTFTFDWGDLTFGQFKIPISWEGSALSSSRLLFPERAPAGRAWGDRRDIGLRLAKTFEHWGYALGIFNGAGQNRYDLDAYKDVAVRLEAYPVEGLTLATLAYVTANDHTADVTDRYEADVRYENGGLILHGEFLYARDVNGDGAVAEGLGFHAQIAYTFAGAFQPVLRAGYLDRDLDEDVQGSRDEFWHVDAGFNWLISGHNAKLQIAYARYQYDDIDPVNEVILALQGGY